MTASSLVQAFVAARASAPRAMLQVVGTAMSATAKAV